MSQVEVERYPALLGGERVLSGETFEDLDPSTGRLCAEVARCRAAEVDQATFREGYDRIDAEDYGPEFGDEDFTYTNVFR